MPDLGWSKTLETEIQSTWLRHNPTLLTERCRRKKTTVHIALKAQKWIERIFGAGSEKSDFVSKAVVDYHKQSAEGMDN